MRSKAEQQCNDSCTARWNGQSLPCSYPSGQLATDGDLCADDLQQVASSEVLESRTSLQYRLDCLRALDSCLTAHSDQKICPHFRFRFSRVENNQHPTVGSPTPAAMERVPMTPVEFPVPGLLGSPSSRSIVHKEIPKRIVRMPECDAFVRSLHKRLHVTHDVVAAHEDDQWRVKYCSVLKRTIKLLSKTPPLERLAGDTTSCWFRVLNEKLDEICVGVGLTPAQWQGDWERVRQVQAQELERRLRTASPAALIGQVNGETKLKQAVLEIKLSQNEDTPLAGLKRATLERLREVLSLNTRVITSETLGGMSAKCILNMFPWYIHEQDVQLTGGIPLVGSGTYGTVSQGTWRDRNGITHEVIVKSLVDRSSESGASFFNQLRLWQRLPKHRNIIRLFGGSHLAKQPFFVCENAPYGTIVSS